mgnify:CR=1 FL=1
MRIPADRSCRAPGTPGTPHAPATESLIGEVLEGRYRIDAYLARGGMSPVYRGVDTRLDRPVAIKVMTPQYAADPTFLVRFEREARAAARLDNPHVVGVYDQGRDGENVFLVMELVDGGTLRDLVHQQGQLSVRTALSVLEPTLDALAAAHAAGLVHRDVKPENVLISSRGEVKVADFGLVRAVTSTTMATGDVILGTVAYLSPEQVETGAADERSDVYAAGVVAYEMLTRRPPFGGDNALSVAYQHVHSDVPPVADAAPGVPEGIAAVIDAATSRDALDRPANAGEFLRELRRARLAVGLSLAPVPVPLRPDRAPGTPSPPRPTTVRPGDGQPTAIQPPAHGNGRPTSAPPDRPARSSAQLARRRGRRRMFIVLAVILLLAAAAALGGMWLANRWTSMPAVLHQPSADAVLAVKDAGLHAALTTRHDNAVPSGDIAAADPPADTRQRRGATVSLVVSSGRPVVPHIARGTSRGAAGSLIRAADLTPVTDAAANVYDDVVVAGSVVATKPAAGQSAPIGSDVLMVLSRGPQPQAVPTVAGKLTEDAQNKLLVAGFTLGPVKTEFRADVPAGTVIGTDPPADAMAPHGSPVSLVLADSKTVPSVDGGTVADAAQSLRAAGFTVTIGTPVFDATVPGGQVVAIDPPAGTRIDPANPDVTVIGSNAVTVPSVTTMTVSRATQVLADEGLEAKAWSLFGGDNAIVTSQQPDAGALVEPGSTVSLTAWP